MFFFIFHRTSIILDISYLLPSMLWVTSSPPSSSTSYSSYPNNTIHTAGIMIVNVLVASCCIVQLPTVCLLESCTNNLMKHVDLHATSYSQLFLPPASSLLLSSSTLYLSRPNDTIHTTSILIVNILLISYRVVHLPTVYHLESCTNNLTKHIDLCSASYSQLSFLSASSAPSSSSILYSLHPTDAINVPAFSSILYLLHHVVLYIFSLDHRESCTNNLTKHIDRVAMSHL